MLSTALITNLQYLTCSASALHSAAFPGHELISTHQLLLELHYVLASHVALLLVEWERNTHPHEAWYEIFNIIPFSLGFIFASNPVEVANEVGTLIVIMLNGFPITHIAYSSSILQKLTSVSKA